MRKFLVTYKNELGYLNELVIDAKSIQSLKEVLDQDRLVSVEEI